MNDGTNTVGTEANEPLTKEKIDELREMLKYPRYEGVLPRMIDLGGFKLLCNKFMPDGIMMCSEETFRRLLGEMGYEHSETAKEEEG